MIKLTGMCLVNKSTIIWDRLRGFSERTSEGFSDFWTILWVWELSDKKVLLYRIVLSRPSPSSSMYVLPFWTAPKYILLKKVKHFVGCSPLWYLSNNIKQWTIEAFWLKAFNRALHNNCTAWMFSRSGETLSIDGRTCTFFYVRKLLLCPNQSVPSKILKKLEIPKNKDKKFSKRFSLLAKCFTHVLLNAFRKLP